VAQRNPTACCAAYFASFVCDELDGRFARKFHQCSTLGSVLDMVTDRVATACLLAVLAARYPAAHLPFLLLIMLDIFRWEPPSPTLVLVGSVLLSSCLFQPAAATPARCCAA
jgi:hypothetical protein